MKFGLAERSPSNEKCRWEAIFGMSMRVRMRRCWRDSGENYKDPPENYD